MVMRFIYGSPIEDEIARLTAEDVPNHELDISEALNFADKIRSKEFSAKDTAKALRDRLGFPNPNVQILAINLADICVKNGGSLIQLEISRREFIDAISGLLDSRTGRDYELRQLVLRIIQEWAALFRGNSETSYVSGVMERLKRSGYSFPKISIPSGDAMIDTASAPEWEDSPVCQRCRTTFTFTNRKHHCRNCGKCYCNDCSSNNAPIPKFAIYESVRVCHGCYLRLKKIVPDIEGAESTPGSFRDQPAPSRQRAKSHTPTPNIAEDDADLKAAIELSLKEAQSRPNYAEYTLQGSQTLSAAAAPTAHIAPVSAAPITTRASQTQYPSVSAEPFPLTSAPSNAQEDEEDDSDLRAAIEASLRDIPSGSGVPDYMPASNNTRQAPDQYPAPANDTDDDAPLSAFMPAADIDEDADPLSTTEKENIQLFESLLTRIQDSGQDIRNDPQVQYLHESIGQLHPKVTDAMENVDHKHKEFIKLHDRIITAIKIYDQLLDNRLRSSTYISASSAVPSTSTYMPTQQSLYPAVPTQQASFGQPAQPQYVPPTNPAFSQPYQQPPEQHAPPLHAQHPAHGDAQAPQVRSLYSQQLPIPSQVLQQVPQSLPMSASQAFAASSSRSSVVLAPQLDVGASQPGAYVPHTSPSMYSVPPAVLHVPSFPALQPAAKTSSASVTATPVVASAPAPVSSSEPEEVMLIEF
ncbi:Vacuolar protein-sorting-associated protein 27 [Coemansia sp. RSA 1822]|nr:Vacuolar protein-sorting-associated protein 27 [Coemansia sp. RSA 638]KAJ2560259.1 Vacuolar protein-sorting-associated protein 27 [Coemansia sp. RSA 1822]